MKGFRGKISIIFFLCLCLLQGRAAMSADVLESHKLFVQFKPGKNSASNVLSTLRSFSVRNEVSMSSHQYLPLTQTHVIEVSADADMENVAEQLRKDSAVNYVEIDVPIHAHEIPNDQFFNEQWPLVNNNANIGAEEAWNMNHSSENIVIATIDSGVDYSHEDLSVNLWKNPKEIPDNGIDDDGNGYVDDVMGYDFFNKDGLPYDDFGHGTEVFGIIGASGNNQKGVAGLNWNARIMSLKVLDSQGNSSISTAVEAIEYAIQQKANIINLSWGYTGAPSQTLEQAIQKARDAGILIVASAGNSLTGSGVDNDKDATQANYPSSYPEDNIIAVAATDTSDQLANFSYYGVRSVDLGAPGVGIYSTSPQNGYEYFTGTSAAAPFVTGSAALVWAFNPSLNYSEVKRLILETTDPVSSLQGKTFTGGRLNIAKALSESPAGGGNLLNTEPRTFSTDLPPPQEAMGSSGGCSLEPGSSKMSYGMVWIGFGFLEIVLLWKRSLPLLR
jgi:subtilisin family serine protease